jgi:DNA-directed RNA polymerase specialized sigma24 family protein
MAITLGCDEDRLLLERVGRRDQQAIASLYDRHAGVVYSIALRVLGDPVLAEQLLSDIFLEVWRTPDHFVQAAGNLSASMALIAGNRALAMRLHQSSSDLERAPLYGIANYDPRYTTHEAACAAINDLPMERRMVLKKAFFHRGTQPEIAAVTAKPRETEKPVLAGEVVSALAGTGIEVVDLQGDAAFARRQLHVRDVAAHIEGMNRLARVFAETPTNILQQLVTAAVDLCEADSAGISVEQKDGTDDNFYHWVATAGQYSGFADAKLPRYPSACGLTREPTTDLSRDSAVL